MSRQAARQPSAGERRSLVDLRAAVASNVSAPAWLLTLLADDSETLVRVAVAGNEAAPTKVLERLSSDTDELVRRSAAGNPAASAISFARLVFEEHLQMPTATTEDRVAELIPAINRKDNVRLAISGNPAAPATVLDRLSQDANRIVRLSVAGNPAAPATVLDRLSGDANSFVRQAVAGNPAAAAATLERLAGDVDTRVRVGVAGNPMAPVDVLKRLSGDINRFTRQYVVGDLGAAMAAAMAERRDFSDNIDELVRIAIAANQAAPVDFLEPLSDDADLLVRLAVAANRAAPATLLERLSQDIDEAIRWTVADNPAAPVAVLERFSCDADDILRSFVASNPATPAVVLERLSGDANDNVRWTVASNPAAPAAILERLSGDAEETVRWSVADNPAAPASVLERLSGDSKTSVLQKVARNPATPLHLLLRLTKMSEAQFSPPSNGEAERALLGTILINNRAYKKVSNFLRPEHFSDAVNGRIFQTCGWLLDQGRIATPLTLKAILNEHAVLQDAGEVTYLFRLTAFAVSRINAEDYGRDILDCYLGRELIEKSANTIGYDFFRSKIGDDRSLHAANVELLKPMLPFPGDLASSRRTWRQLISGFVSDLIATAFRVEVDGPRSPALHLRALSQLLQLRSFSHTRISVSAGFSNLQYEPTSGRTTSTPVGMLQLWAAVSNPGQPRLVRISQDLRNAAADSMTSTERGWKRTEERLITALKNAAAGRSL